MLIPFICLLAFALAAWGVPLLVRQRELAALSGSPVKFCPGCGKIVVRRTIGDRLRIACRYCDFVHWNNPKPVTITIVPSGSGIVLVRRKNNPAAGSWALPGGYIESYESAEQGAIREVREEVGLAVEIDRLVGVFTPATGVNEIILVYLAKPVSAPPVAGDDAVEAGVFSSEDLPEPIVFKLHKYAIDRFFSGSLK